MDDFGQETKDKDPVEAIRISLNKALGFLKQLLGQEDKELAEEMKKVEDVSQDSDGVSSSSD